MKISLGSAPSPESCVRRFQRVMPCSFGGSIGPQASRNDTPRGALARGPFRSAVSAQQLCEGGSQ